jgi:hypothetical protein
MFVPVALTVAGVWLTNVPAAITATYVAVLLLAMVTIRRRNSRVFVWGGGAIAMGLLLASFYIVPVLYEKSWITVTQFLSAGVRPGENFLFTRIGEPEHDNFLRGLSWLAVGEVVAKAITSSTVSSESAPRSSTNEALEVTSPSSTPNCSTIICFTFSSTAAMFLLQMSRFNACAGRGP